MKKSKIITVLLLINVFLIGIFVTSVDALQNNLSSNSSDVSSRPLPISDNINMFIHPEKRIQNSFYQIYPIPPVKPDTSTYKSLSTTTSNNSLKITSLNYTNIAKPGGPVNISFTVDGYIDNTDYYIGIYDWASGTWIKDDYQYHNGTFSKRYDWNFTAMPTGQKYWLSVWYWESSNSSFIFLDGADIIINPMLPDLTVKDIIFSNNIAIVNISNSGYTSANNISYLVFDGNPNPNYMSNNSYRKTELIHSDKIPVLNISEFKLVSISFPIDQDFHKAYVVVDPMNTINETNETNNNASKAMRLNSSTHVLDVLAVIYTNYVYNNLSTSQISFTKNQTSIFKQFYWNHTLTLSLNISYMQIDDLYNNSHLWEISPGAYWMSPWDVESDLRKRGVTDNAYDIIYVFYAWENTNGSGAAYGGAAYGPDINWMGNTSYASEPIFCWDPNTIGEIAIHEVLHNIDGMYEVKGDSSFKSSDNMNSETNFTIPMEYYEWMLETWPTQKWFDLKWGYFTSTPTASVSIASQTVTPGGTVTLPIMANNITNVAAYSINLTYNPAVVVVDSVGAGALGGVTANINNAAGVTRMLAFTLTPQSGNVVLANVVLRAVGTAGQTSPLALAVTTLTDNNGNTIPATVNNGTLTIMAPVNGAISGIVTSASSGLAIYGATVTAGGLTAATNYSGAYYINIAPGTYPVTASAAGYNSANASVTVTSGTTFTKNFALAPISGGPVISIASQTVTPGSNVTVPIMANNITNVAAYTISLTYNPAVVAVDSVGAGAMGGVTTNINNAAGVTQMSGFSLTPQSGNVTLANVVLRAVGTAGQTGPLNLVVTTLSDNNGNNIPNTVINGTFNISSVKKGDVTGDGKVDITDALFIAQYTVGLRNLTPTQLVAGDVNCDGKVDITDALFIAQYTVGLRTTFC